jgi:RNA polymerase sigma factor (sigma-70 family)
MLEDTHASSFIGLWPCGLTGASPFEATAASEMERQIEAAIASFPATYREVLLLVGVDGLRPVEAAEICGISPEAFRQRLSRARALLTSKLEGPVRSRVAALSEVTP